MKKHNIIAYSIIGALLCPVPSMHPNAQCKTSQTFMYTRPVYERVGAIDFLWRHAIADDRPCGGAVRVTPLFQKSITACKTNGYFLLNCQNKVLIAGDNTTQAKSRNVRAEWLGLPSDFQGTVSLEPHQHQLGALITYNHDLQALTNINFFEHSWLEIAIPIVSVTNELKLIQSNVTIGGKAIGPELLVSTFNNPAMRFARVAPCKLKKTGIAEIQFTFGTNFVNKNGFLFTYYTTLVVPGTGKNDPTYLFSPVIGTNGQFGITAGIQSELPLQSECCDYTLSLFINAENHFLHHNHQIRTFDIRGKQWSRYMQLRQEDQPNTIPAAKVTSECVRVTSYSLFNLTTGFVTAFDRFRFEIGYDLWAHPSEAVSLLNPSCEGRKPAITAYGIAGTGTNSASKSTICKLAADDPEFVKLFRSDLNTTSGVGRGTLVQGLHLAAGYYCKGIFFGMGDSWELPHNNAALEQWSVFLTAGASF